jgi:hypothetical protein
MAAKNPFPALDSLTIALPRGLSFTGDSEHGHAGVRIRGVADATLLVRHGRLEVTPPDSIDQISLTVRAPALRENPALLRRVQRVASHPARSSQATRIVRLRLTVIAADSVNNTFREVVNLVAS